MLSSGEDKRDGVKQLQSSTTSLHAPTVSSISDLFRFVVLLEKKEILSQTQSSNDKLDIWIPNDLSVYLKSYSVHKIYLCCAAMCNVRVSAVVCNWKKFHSKE